MTPKERGVSTGLGSLRLGLAVLLQVPKDKGREIEAIMEGMQKFTEVKAPVLAIFAGPHLVGPYGGNDPAVKKYEALDAEYMKRASGDFQKGVPSARVMLLPHASHYVFLSNEADVLREMRAFIDGLAETGGQAR